MAERQLGVCFSGGGARGIAHLGVLQALLESGLPIGHVTGVSSGAIAAAFHAAGFAPREVLGLLADTRFLRLVRPSFSRGVLQLEQLQKLYAHYLGPDRTFAELAVPLTLAVTDLGAGETLYYERGLLIPPLLGTTTVPVLCRPVEYEGRLLVDGGVMNNLPVEPLLDRSHLLTVGVHCNPFTNELPLTSLREISERTAYLAILMNTLPRLARCHFVVEPPELRHFKVTDLRRANELFDIGYAHTLTRLPALRQQLMA
ncbi:patatin-like phospholipase family protein [Hymenobacter sp. BT175]|uniref:patatin-like phospholipase family protein n=1 Tax=Hymenobacter translucens TaxID=2886507 RepID=UPI001D0ED2FC|nr:patatin-like phospholipase family protein [Hymenobacter translucens]MCC2546304.1 patatin-like phospholipase family protein [Hymenobacter translucens]